MNALMMKDIISIKIKPRNDSYSDQFNRIFMVKMYLLSSVLIGIDYFHDSVSCIINTNEIEPQFVHSACWINGFYIFPELAKRPRKSGYYGVPKDLNHDGVDTNGQLCAVHDRFGERNKFCEPLPKVFYLQYQWYPFYIGSLALLHYVPYIIFRIANSDILSLKSSLKEQMPPELILRTYFNHNLNPPVVMKFRTVGNIAVKFLYVLVNVLCFYSMDASLNRNFLFYGINWLSWAKMSNSVAHDMYNRKTPKPSHKLLPPMGICEIHEAARDVRNTVVNRHKFVCEISPNILYQYVLLILWWLMVIAIFISTTGALVHVLGQFKALICFYCRGNQTLQIYRLLSLRECAYMEYIRVKALPMYAELMKTLQLRRQPGQEMNRFSANMYERHNSSENERGTLRRNHNSGSSNV